MRLLFILFSICFSLSALAVEKVEFTGEITEKSLAKLQEKITKKAAKIPAGADRTILLDLQSGGGNLFATLKFVAGIPGLSKALNVVINTRVKSDCESSCTVLFTAGTERLARKWAKFGFHSPKIASKLPPGLSKQQVLDNARTRWYDAIGAVDMQLASDLQRHNYLMHAEMSFYRGNELLHGYVTQLY
jgi:hypothetical protein